MPEFLKEGENTKVRCQESMSFMPDKQIAKIQTNMIRKCNIKQVWHYEIQTPTKCVPLFEEVPNSRPCMKACLICSQKDSQKDPKTDQAKLRWYHAS